jgi:diacylglycerol kinase family enzyme
MARYTAITIIYNPHSTRRAKRAAEELRDELKRRLPKQKLRLAKTKRAGHAEQLAYRAARAGKRPLIISASGDGGYHEVVNGLLRAQAEGASPTAGLVPAGNANDHFRNLNARTELAQQIAVDNVRTIDVLRFEYTADGKRQSRYAHSYIGLGLTPHAARQLNTHNLSKHKLLEIWLVAKAILTLRTTRLIVRGTPRRYDSLIFSNIPSMSKYLSLSDISSAQDGKFEVTAFRRRNKFRLLMTLVTASTRGLKGTNQSRSYTFRTLKPQLVQLDGEIIRIDGDSEASVGIEPGILHCIV